MSIYRLHDTTGDDLGLLEHCALNLEPGDVVVVADGREAVVTARAEAEPGWGHLVARHSDRIAVASAATVRRGVLPVTAGSNGVLSVGLAQDSVSEQADLAFSTLLVKSATTCLLRRFPESEES